MITSIAAASIAEERKGWLFRTAKGWKGTVLADQPMNQADARRMVRRRAAAAGIQSTDRLPDLPRDRDHSLFGKWRDARARPRHGRARKPPYNQAL